MSKFYDNGSRDALLEELGIEKLSFAEVVQKLESNGIKVISSHEKRINELKDFEKKLEKLDSV